MTNDRNAASYAMGTPHRIVSEPQGSRGLPPCRSFGHFSWTSKKSVAVGRHDRVKTFAMVTIHLCNFSITKNCAYAVKNERYAVIFCIPFVCVICLASCAGSQLLTPFCFYVRFNLSDELSAVFIICGTAPFIGVPF